MSAQEKLRTLGQEERPADEVAVVYSDREFDHFDAQSEQVVDYRHRYVKTSTGRFRGRRTVAHVGRNVLIHLQSVNSAMSLGVTCPEKVLGLGVSMGPPGSAINGIQLDRSDLVITRPGSELELTFPAKGATLLTLAVEQGLVESLISTEAGREHLCPERGGVSVVRTAWVAGALETGALGLLRACDRAPGARLPASTATALVAGIVAAFDLQAGLGAARDRSRGKRGFATFADARDVLAAMQEFNYEALTVATGRSPRSIQLAFSQYARTTPLRYFRALKLQRVREVLLTDSGDRRETIGDIAAAHGFSSWSRFTQLYRLQFGEAPSQTRARGRCSSHAPVRGKRRPEGPLPPRHTMRPAIAR